jgi:hypothetical protein
MADYWMVSTGDTSAALYLAAIELYLATPNLTEIDVEKSGDTYTITENNGIIKIKFDDATTSYSLEFWDGDKLEFLCESTKLGNNHYAYQAYYDEDTTKTVIQMLINGANGSLSVNTGAADRPSSIYKAKSVSSTFAKSGTRVYTFENNQYTFTGNLDTGPAKTVTNISIKSGLKQEYELNETFSLTGIVLRVTYDDQTTADVNLTEVMVVGTAPNTASVGTKTLTISYSGYQKSFTFTVIDPSQPQKQVTNISIVSGLAHSYYVNDPFDITDILIKITYNDGSEQNLYVTEAMVSGTAPTTATAGNKTLTLSYKGHTQSFTFKVTVRQMSPAEKLVQSTDNFLNTFIFGESQNTLSFYFNLGGLLFSVFDQPDTMEFLEEFMENTWDEWSLITLLYDGVNVIDAYESNQLELYYPDPAQNFGKTAYVNYDEATETYNIGYWYQVVYTTYWWEQEISYDDDTDSLKATIKCGVDEHQLIRGYVEYNQISAGHYAANLYFPVDENDDEGLYTSYEFQFTATEGNIAINRWSTRPATIFGVEPDFSNYGKSGDAVLTVGDESLSFETSLNCEAEEFFYDFIGGDYVDGIEDEFLERMLELCGDDYFFDDYMYSIESSSLSMHLYLLETYQKKIFDYNEFDNVEIDINGNTTTFTVENGDEETIYSFSYSANRLSLSITGESYQILEELVKDGDTYYVQKVEGSYEYYYVYQAIYVDEDTMNFSYNLVYTLPQSIYTSVPVDFATEGYDVFSVVNGVVTYTKE